MLHVDRICGRIVKEAPTTMLQLLMANTACYLRAARPPAHYFFSATAGSTEHRRDVVGVFIKRHL